VHWDLSVRRLRRALCNFLHAQRGFSDSLHRRHELRFQAYSRGQGDRLLCSERYRAGCHHRAYPCATLLARAQEHRLPAENQRRRARACAHPHHLPRLGCADKRRRFAGLKALPCPGSVQRFQRLLQACYRRRPCLPGLRRYRALAGVAIGTLVALLISFFLIAPYPRQSSCCGKLQLLRLLLLLFASDAGDVLLLGARQELLLRPRGRLIHLRQRARQDNLLFPLGDIRGYVPDDCRAPCKGRGHRRGAQAEPCVHCTALRLPRRHLLPLSKRGGAPLRLPLRRSPAPGGALRLGHAPLLPLCNPAQLPPRHKKLRGLHLYRDLPPPGQRRSPHREPRVHAENLKRKKAIVFSRREYFEVKPLK